MARLFSPILLSENNQKITSKNPLRSLYSDPEDMGKVLENPTFRKGTNYPQSTAWMKYSIIKLHAKIF